MATLIFKNGIGEERKHQIKDLPVTIGRLPSNNIVIPDGSVSRNHAKIIYEDGKYKIFDLGSKNGTLVNGKKISFCILKDKDEIRLGNISLIFSEEKITPEVLYHDEHIDMETPSTVIKSIPSSDELYTKEHKKLEVLYNISKTINAIYDLDTLFDKVVEIIFNTVDADRCLIMIKDKSSGNLVPKTAKRKNGTSESEVSVSQTIVNRVVTDGVSILVCDVRLDQRFKKAESIMIRGIKSIMCVPLWTKDTIIGLLYLDSHVKVRCFSEDELDLLTAIGNQVAVAIQNISAQLELFKKRNLEFELELAARIQQSFFPKGLPKISSFEVGAKSIPALKVGGDFYDFFQLDQDNFGFLIGDVSGKGMPAALYMARLISDFRFLCHNSISPAEILSFLNQKVQEMVSGEAFVTAAYVILNVSKKFIVYSNAGHHPIFFYTRKDKAAVELILKETTPLGIAQQVNLKEDKRFLEIGDIMVLYTDGVIEARNSKGELFGKERFKELVKKSCSCEPDELISKIITAIDEFAQHEEQEDDITILVIKRI